MIKPAAYRRPRALAVVAGVLAGAVSLGLPPAPGPGEALAQGGCDAQCWAILRYLTEQGLTPAQIEDLGNSGIQPDTTEPDTTEPDTTQPDTTQPDTTKPDTTKPDTTEPDTTDPDTTEPDTTEPPTRTQRTVSYDPSPVDDSPPPGGPEQCIHCDNVTDGIKEGWYPEELDYTKPTQTTDLLEILEDFGKQHPAFDSEAAIGTLRGKKGEADRFDMAEALADGLGIPFAEDDPSTPADERMGAVRELADRGIVFGYDGDQSTVSEEDFGGSEPLGNGHTASFLNRIREHLGRNPGSQDPAVGPPPGGNPADTKRPGPGPDEACKTGLPLTGGESAAFAAQLSWRTLVGIEPGDGTGPPWPPHPDVPGGREHLVVSQSPVWPVVDADAEWVTVNLDDGCRWTATGVETRVSQVLPWRPADRQVLEDAGRFDVFLRRWDNLSAGQQAEAARRHRNRDLDVRCALETARVAADSYDECRWELPAPGAWSWQARACFEASSSTATFRECATLAHGVEWFLTINDYTQQITVHGRAGEGTAPNGRPGADGGRRLAPAPAV